MNREHRNLLLDGQLVLISPYDPSAGFNVGNAMQRNKLIYALADASLVVSSDANKGGTWAGAVEQLDKLKFVPVYVRSTGESSSGLDALSRKGALPWPNPEGPDAFKAVLDVAEPSTKQAPQSGPELFPGYEPTDFAVTIRAVEEPTPAIEASGETALPVTPRAASQMTAVPSTPAETLFATVRDVIQALLKSSMKDAEIAAALNVSNAQAKAWLQRLVDEGVIEKQKKPAGYLIKKTGLFE